MQKWFLVIPVFILVVLGIYFVGKNKAELQTPLSGQTSNLDNFGEGNQIDNHPLSIESLKNGEYPGSDLIIEQKLDNNMVI